jgi:outer membrane receptor for ferrienterochelin and colicins
MIEFLKKVLYIIFSLLLNNSLKAQNTFKTEIKDSKTKETIPDVIVAIKNSNIGTLSDSIGKANIIGLKDGIYTIIFSVVGYETKFVTVQLPDTILHVVILEQSENTLTGVMISSTRDDKRIEDAPLKIEVVAKEEMMEEQATRPANVIGLLSDIGGIKVQQTSAVSGNSNVRMQGLDGRYTQILKDGLPLYDGLSGGFGILQIAPLDLTQIELIKGAASTLYGGGAIGGLINFISKKPSTTQHGEFILNQTSLTETNVHCYLSKRHNKWGYTLYSGYTHQDAVDINNDGLSDLPRLQTINFHPKLFYYPDDKTIISAGYSGHIDQRVGGDMNVLRGYKDTVHQFFEKNKTTRNTGDLQAERKFSNGIKVSLKASGSNFGEIIQTNTHYFKGNQWNYFTEASAFSAKEKYDWVFGLDFTGSAFVKRPSDPILLNNFSNNTTGVFGQLTIRLPGKTLLQTGLRLDQNDKYKGFILPCIAMIHHFNEYFAIRSGFGMGYKTPNALDQQNVEYYIEHIHPIADSIKPEHSYGYNLEMNYKKQWDNRKNLFINTAFFLTEITFPIIATEQAGDNIFFSNASKPIITRGLDSYLKLRLGEFEVYAGYTYTVAERKYLSENQFVPLIPREHLSLTATYEIEEKWRFGFESDYTGNQYRDGNSKTPEFYTLSGVLEKDFGKHFATILNIENILDYRQSGYENLYIGTINNPHFKPLWGPIDGRTISLALRYRI